MVSKIQKSVSKHDEMPQCDIFMNVLAPEFMLPSNAKLYFETLQPTIVSKSSDYFDRRLKQLNQIQSTESNINKKLSSSSIFEGGTSNCQI